MNTTPTPNAITLATRNASYLAETFGRLFLPKGISIDTDLIYVNDGEVLLSVTILSKSRVEPSTPRLYRNAILSYHDDLSLLEKTMTDERHLIGDLYAILAVLPEDILADGDAVDLNGILDR